MGKGVNEMSYGPAALALLGIFLALVVLRIACFATTLRRNHAHPEGECMQAIKAKGEGQG